MNGAYGMLLAAAPEERAELQKRITSDPVLFGEAMAAFAGSLLGVEGLDLSSSYGSVPQWDSVNHLRLVMEAEKFFGVSYRLEDIPGMRTLGDFVGAANRVSGCQARTKRV